MDITTILLFTASITLLSIVPGPSVLLVMIQSMGVGLKSGLITTLGIVIGAMLFFSIAYFSINTALAQNGVQGIYHFVQFVSAIYLGWIGYSLIIAASPHLSETDISTSDFSTKEFFAGLSIAMGNPKTILFYASILPSFVDLTNSNISDYMICLGIVGISTALVLSMYAVIGYWMRAHIVSRYIEQWGNKIAGFFFVLMSLYLIYLFSTSL
ncbi:MULTISPECIES: LysE family translocator [Vibrio]|uniref:LysE family translocator n=1 Tax=Vibrio TaxID=662 RepID=UPI001E3EC075|nr:MULTISPECIES: LysE family translocator [Vibrio]MCC4891412.1 LysE family translocator [Vibrio sp. F13]MCW4446215.1 LysE family translocator [Vibrio splendidus]